MKFQDYLRAIKIPLYNFPFLDPLLIYSSLLDLPGKGFSYLENKKDGKTKEIPESQKLPELAKWFQTENPVPWAPLQRQAPAKPRADHQAIGRQVSVQSKQNIMKESIEGGINSIDGLFNSLGVSMEVILI